MKPEGWLHVVPTMPQQLLLLALLAAAPASCACSRVAAVTRGAHAALLQDAAGKPPSQSRLFKVSVEYNRGANSAAEGVTLTMDGVSMGLKASPGTSPGTGVAWAKLDETLPKTGWDTLLVEATDSNLVQNTVKMYAAGFAEGLLMAPRISQFYSNFFQLLAKDGESTAALTNVKNMLYKELEYVKEKTGLQGGEPMSVEPVDAYWKQVRYSFVQMWGIMDGYNAVAESEGVRALDLNDMMVINSNGQLAEMMQAYTPKAVQARRRFQELAAVPSMPAAAALLQQARRKPQPQLRADGGAAPRGRAMTPAEADRDWERRLARRGHCTAFVRVTPENKDLLVGHTTWNDYGKMTRVYKYYKFPLLGSNAAVTLMGFSSYPGCVSSTDDYYTMDSGLAVVDTSLEVLNPQVYQRVPEFPANPHIPNFMHVMAVNRLAKTGAAWTSLYSTYNSGTGSAQWMVVDYNLFTPGEPVKPNTLRLLEQVPGLTHESDISHELTTQRYWASYNRPFFADVRKLAGHDTAEQTYGALYSFAKSPRAEIFSKLGSSVDTLFNMRSIMNRNAYPNEGVLPSEPGHAISARLDLDALNHLPNGGIDAKVTNYCLLRSLQSQAISGPSHANQPVFKWRDASGTDLFPGWPHMGLPDVWDFDWVQMTPSGADAVTDVDQC